jgi:hypothetical protein
MSACTHFAIEDNCRTAQRFDGEMVSRSISSALRTYAPRDIHPKEENDQCTDSAVVHEGIMSLTGVIKMSCNNPP